MKSNLDLKIAQARVREARAEYGIAVGNLLPTVDATGAYARQRQSKHQPVLGSLPLPRGVPFENDVYQAGFDASWEIDIFGGKRRAAEAAKAQVAAAQFGERDVLVTLLGEVARNYVQARGYQRQLEIARENIRAEEQVRRRSLEDAVKSSQESLRLANQLYADGLSDFINVLDAERSLYQAQDAPVQSDRTVSTDVIALYKSLGGGWESKTKAVAMSAGTSPDNSRGN